MEHPQQPPPQTVLPQPQVQPQPLQPQPAQPMMMYQPQYKPPQFRRLKARHSVFKVGAGLLFLSTVIFIVGFSAPAWLEKTGLWMSCVGKYCSSNTDSGTDWFNAVRAMETFSLVFFLLSVGMLLYQDVFKTPLPLENKAVESLAVLAGVCGLIGSAIFGAKVQLTREVYYNNFNGTYMVYSYSHTHRWYLQWGYGLATAAAILVLVSAVLVAHSRCNHAAYTAQRAAMAGVSLTAPAPSQAFAPPMAMTPMHPQTVMAPAAGYAYPMPPAYPQTYPYPYPMPPATAMVSPPPVAQGPLGSQVPVAYVMNQGRIIPVYEGTAATTTTVAEDGTTTNRL